MRKFVFAFVVAVAGMVNIAAQEKKAEGEITVPGGYPADSAIIRIVDMRTGHVLWNGYSDAYGHFILPGSAIAEDSLSINILHYGYKPWSSAFSGLRYPVNVELEPLSYELEGATVTGETPEIMYDKGDMVVNIQQLKNYERLNLDEALQRIPGIWIEDDGIRLYGVKTDIYLNGIKQSMTAEAVLKYIQSLPANAVESIRIIAMPGNRYGKSEAVIDIRLKTSMPDGLYSQSSLSGGMEGTMPGAFGVSEFLMLKKGKTTFNTTLSYDNNNQWHESMDSSYFAIPDRYVVSMDSNNGRLGNIYSSSNLTVELPGKQSLDFNAFIYWDHENNTMLWNTTDGSPASAQKLTKKYRSSTTGSDDLYSLTVKYSTPDDKKHSFSAYYSGMYGSLNDRGNYYYEEDYGWNGYLNTDYRMRGHQHFLKADAVAGLGEYWEIEYGVRSSLGFMTDNTYNKDFSSGETINSTDFKGHELVAGGYIKGIFNITENHGLSIDAGYDYTWFGYESRDEVFSRKYGDFVPKLNYWLNVKDYSLRIQAYPFVSRPNYSIMLPGIRYVNNYMYSTGNPEFVNKTSYIARIDQTFWTYLNLRFTYSLSRNYIDSYYGYDQDADMIYLSYGNLYDMNLYDITLSCPYMFWKEKIYGSLLANYQYVDLFNINPDVSVRTSDVDWHYIRLELYFYYDITDRLTFNISGRWIKPDKRLQQSLDKHYLNFNTGLSYAFLKDKNLAASLYVSSIAPHLAEREYTYFFGDNVFRSLSRNLTTATLSLRYSFSIGQEVSYRDNSGNFERMMK